MIELITSPRGILLTLILGSFAMLYAFLSIRDTVGDLNFVFERRLLRKLRSFSLARLLMFTTAAACFFALMRIIDADWGDAVFLALLIGFVYSMGSLLRMAFQDVRAKGVRRRYREEFNASDSAGDAPRIEVDRRDSL